MYVCYCIPVTDSVVQEAIDNGACSLAEIVRCTEAGSCCGDCHEKLEDLLANAKSSAKLADIVS